MNTTQTPANHPNPDLNPTTLDIPAFLMNVPFSYNNTVANNIWMRELAGSKREVNLSRAIKQFMELYHYISSQAFVQIIPTPQGCTLQDLVFTANLGIVLDHLADKNTVIISNFMSEPRIGETQVGVDFFTSMGYSVEVCPHKFEGEAELKHLHDNVYIGGYGIRSDMRAYEWMEEKFAMNIIKVKETDEYLYHLDCFVFPVMKEQTMVCTEILTNKEIKAIEKHTNIIAVSTDDAYSGVTNSVRLHNAILNASNIHELKAGTEDYRYEIHKNRKLADIGAELGFEVVYFNLDEYMKGGGLLSCMVMHLNRQSYQIELI